MSGFANMWALGLAGLTAVMAGLYVVYSKRDTRAREAYADRLRHLPLGLGVSGYRAYALLALAGLAVLMGSFAAARPVGPPDGDASGSAVMDVIVALDVSDSMAVVDNMPNRLAYAKSTIASIAAAAPANRYGLVLFSGEATVSCPLTSDHDAFLSFLDGAGFARSGLPGTAIGEAILTAATRFKPGELPRAVLVVTDGENTYGADPVEAAASARARGLKVYTLGVGTPSGGRIPVGRDFFGDITYKRDRQDQVVVSKLDGPALENIAGSGGGQSYIAGDGGAVAALAKALTGKEAKAVKGVPADAKEYGQYFAFAAFLVMTAAILL